MFSLFSAKSCSSIFTKPQCAAFATGYGGRCIIEIKENKVKNYIALLFPATYYMTACEKIYYFKKESDKGIITLIWHFQVEVTAGHIVPQTPRTCARCMAGEPVSHAYFTTFS